MIEKLVIQKLTIAGKEYEYPDTTALVGKFNELADAVNRLEESVQGVVNNSIADGGRIQSLQEQIHALKTRPENVPELTHLQKENNYIKDNLERITDILYESKYALEEVINPSFISHEQEMAKEALDKVNAEIKAITGE
jgi:hemerythrin superfamily protein